MNKITPNFYQRLEAGVLMIAAIWLYFHLGGSWVWLIVLFFSFDLSALAYLAGPSIGALAYNKIHNHSLPLIIGVYGVAAGQTWAQLFSLIWLAHLGFDRVQGFGLKFTDSFWHTHLGIIKPPKFSRK